MQAYKHKENSLNENYSCNNKHNNKANYEKKKFFSKKPINITEIPVPHNISSSA